MLAAGCSRVPARAEGETGVQGGQGLADSSLAWFGPCNSAANYNKGSIISYSKGVYVAKEYSTADSLSSDARFWDVIVEPQTSSGDTLPAGQSPQLADQIGPLLMGHLTSLVKVMSIGTGGEYRYLPVDIACRFLPQSLPENDETHEWMVEYFEGAVQGEDGK